MSKELARLILKLKTFPSCDRDGYRDETALTVDAKDWRALCRAAEKTLNRRG